MNMNLDNNLQNMSSFSPRSENNNNSFNTGLEKKIDNLKYENNLLKAQLNKER